MEEYIITNTSINSQSHTQTFPKDLENYEDLLKWHGIEYKSEGYYLEVGDIREVQGWILHLSVVISQLASLFELVLPILNSHKVRFRIPADREMALSILNGSLGSNQLGKIISIYATDNHQLNYLTKLLVETTKNFNGPEILTDVYLGGVVYTRYGSIHPLIFSDTNGKRFQYIYDSSGQLAKDPYSIPFKIPVGITWPYEQKYIHTSSPTRKILNHIYKPLFLLKSDLKGNVYKGIYVTGFLRTSKCVIKEGRKHIFSDDHGRDIHDRLVWQQELHQDLAGKIPLPKVIDLFKEDGNTYLVMDLVNGISFYDYLKQFNLNNKSWHELVQLEKKILLECLLKIVNIVDTLHKNGYVHRDIAPGNFIINSKGEFTLIDMELAYSIYKNSPNPPFVLGTPGYISPEQRKSLIPTFKEDFYGIGALMLTVFTGLLPVKFDVSDRERLERNLLFFINDISIVQLISKSLSHNAHDRPDLETIRNVIKTYNNKLTQNNIDTNINYFPEHAVQNVKAIIASALNGLNNPPIVISEYLWYSEASRSENGGISREYTRYAWMYEGIAGVLYVLSRAKIQGYDITSSESSCKEGWKFIENEYFIHLPEIAPGLYNGAAGVALSIAEGIRAGLLDNNEHNQTRIRQCLELETSSLGLSSGIAGQSIAILRCKNYLSQHSSEELLTKHVNTLLSSQQKDGSWLLTDNPQDKKGVKDIGFGNGISGIIWFLLEYYSYNGNKAIEASFTKGLEWIAKRTHELRDLFDANVFKRTILQGKEKGDERKGIILTFIKAYEITKRTQYKSLAEAALIKYPKFTVKTNLGQDTGLAGLGEIYIEAWKVFGNEEWKNRADWIAQVFIHTFNESSSGAGYWVMDSPDSPTADLMTGTSGIIHFLMRNLNPDKMGYRLLS